MFRSCVHVRVPAETIEGRDGSANDGGDDYTDRDDDGDRDDENGMKGEIKKESGVK